ncbi:MAG: 2-oxo acid dehydrogenase subunit E2 [Lachnospiraceae bacterium]|nr:2-oxo acid dehydrogenase subunit E2 [Lachnospiraceae bacterium]
MQPFAGRKRRWGDRNDGFLVRNMDPMSKVVPYIMTTMTDSWVLFEDKIDITHTQEFIRDMRAEKIPGLTLYQVIFAAVVRTISQVPQINRFEQNRRIYARNHIKMAMVVKKGMSLAGERTTLMPFFDPEDTIFDVVDKINNEMNKIDRTVTSVEEDENKTSFDALEVALSSIPNFLMKLVFWLLKKLDKLGLLPRMLTDLSPFHTTAFITNMGSFGMDAVYHHIYEFGTLSIFGAIGNKEIVYETQRDGSVKRRVYLNMKFVADERITDGFSYGMAFKHIKSYIGKPEKLLTPPEKVVEDVIDKVKRKKK